MSGKLLSPCQNSQHSSHQVGSISKSSAVNKLMLHVIRFTGKKPGNSWLAIYSNNYTAITITETSLF